VKPVRLTDGCTPDARLHRRGKAIAQAVTIAGPWEKWFIPEHYESERWGRLTPERF